MQIEFKLKRILPVLAGLALLWAIFLLSRFLLKETENSNHNYIPANSLMVMRIDGKQFIGSAAYDLVYKTGDDAIFQQLKELSVRHTGQSKLRDAGIDLLSNVIVFTEQFEDKNIIGLLFNLSDERKFKDVMPGIVARNQAFSSNGEIGVFLSDPSKSINNERLLAHARKLLTARSKPAYIKEWNGNDGTFLNLRLRDQPDFGSASLEARLNGSLLAFSGDLEIAEKPRFSTVSLRPDGFHFSVAILSQRVQDSLKNLLLQQGFDFPDIARVSANYRGINLDGFAPMADLLLEFESPVDLSEILANADGWKNLRFTAHKTTALTSTNPTFQMMYGSTSYTVSIVDDQTLFIGLEPKNVLKQKSDHLLLMKGDVEKITSLKGGGFGMSLGINLYPPYRLTKEFLASISAAEAQIVPQKGKYVLDGKVQFQEGKYPVSETLRLILGLSH